MNHWCDILVSNQIRQYIHVWNIADNTKDTQYEFQCSSLYWMLNVQKKLNLNSVCVCVVSERTGRKPMILHSENFTVRKIDQVDCWHKVQFLKTEPQPGATFLSSLSASGSSSLTRTIWDHLFLSSSTPPRLSLLSTLASSPCLLVSLFPYLS